MHRQRRFIGSSARVGALMLCASILGCHIQGLNFSNLRRAGTGLNTTAATTNSNSVAGLTTAQSDTGFTNTFDTLNNNVAGQAQMTQALDFQNTAGQSFNNSAINTNNSLTPASGGIAEPINTAADIATGGNGFATRIGTKTSLSSNNAASVNSANTATTPSSGSSLRPNRLIFFDKPARITPILAADPRAALDLPPRLLVYQANDGATRVAYNNSDYLAARYRLGSVRDALAALDNNLQTLAQEAAGNGVATLGSVRGLQTGEGIVAVRSHNDFSTTRNRLTRAIKASNRLHARGQIDNQAAAHRVGLNLNPNTVVLFTDRNTEASWIASAPTVAIDLPQKILIAEKDNGDVVVYYNKPSFILNRHHITDVASPANTLAKLVHTATARR